MFEYAKSRSQVASWIYNNRDKMHPFRMRDICNFKGATSENEDTSEYLEPIEKRLSPAMAHRVMSDLVERQLLEPTISRTKVEVFLPLIDGREKQWKNLIGKGGTFRFGLVMGWRWLKSKLWSVLLWVITVLAATVLREQMFG